MTERAIELHVARVLLAERCVGAISRFRSCCWWAALHGAALLRQRRATCSGLQGSVMRATHHHERAHGRAILAGTNTGAARGELPRDVRDRRRQETSRCADPDQLLDARLDGSTTIRGCRFSPAIDPALRIAGRPPMGARDVAG